MTTSKFSFSPLISFAHSRLARRFSITLLACTITGTALAQEAATDPAQGGGRGRRGQGAERGGRGNFNAEEMQQRMRDNMREQFGVTDDAEWQLIWERIEAVNELRRTTATGGFGGGGGFGRGGGQATSGRGGGRGRGGSPEQESLRQAVTDKLPDAEIKSRLERLRESRKASEDRLTKVQEDLRAVLTVRQEAVAVMSGLLP